jgi:cyanate permease
MDTLCLRNSHRLMIYPINTYAPSLIKSLGFGGYNANGLNSVGSVVSLIISISIAWNSDRTQERGFHIAVGFCVGIAGLLWTALAPVSSSKWVVYGESSLPNSQ